MLELPCLIDGRYRLDRSVGHGGFGHVYAGVHLTLDVRIAVKVLKLPADATPERRADLGARFLEEGRVLTRLRHPNIVAALDLGLLPPGADGGVDPYLVMEWVDGSTIADLLRERGRGLSVADAWTLFEPIADALACAHAAHVVHRDLKPSNVMVVPRAGSSLGVPRVIDFGIAKVVSPDEEPGSGSTETASSDSPFTAAYAAPEQIARSRTGPWTDVHALGLLFVELVTGERPYGDGPDVRLEAVDPDRPTPARRGIDAGPLEAVIARAVSLRPRDRFASAAELLAAAREAARDLPASASLEPRALAPISKRPRRAPSATAPSAPSAPPPSKTERTGGGSTTTVPSPDVSKPEDAKPAPSSRVRFLAIGGAVAIAAGLAFATPRLLAPLAAQPPPRPPPSASTTAEPVPARPPNISVDHVRALTLDPGCEEFPEFFPDEQSIVFSAASGRDYHVIKLDLATNGRTTLTRGDGWQTYPTISRDGGSLLYLAIQTEGTAAYEVGIASPFGTDAGPLGGINRRAPRLVTKGTMAPRYTLDGTAIWAGPPEHPRKFDRATGKELYSFDPPPKTLYRSVIEIGGGRMLTDAEDIYGRSLGIVLYVQGKEAEPTWLLKKPLKASFALSPKGDAVFATVGAPGAANYELWRAPLDGSGASVVPGNSLVPVRGITFTKKGDRALWSNCDSFSDLVPLEPGGPGEWKIKPPTDARKWIDEIPVAIPGTRSLVVRSNRDGDYGLWVIDEAGAAPARKLDTGDLRPLPADVSHDGALVAFAAVDRGLFVMATDGHEKPRQVTSDPTHNSPRFSRDDKRLFIEVQGKGDHSWIESVSIDGGPTQKVIGADTGGPAVDPKRDALVLVKANGDDYDIVELDLATNAIRKLLPGFLPRGGVAFSSDGERFAYSSDFECGEYDLAKHTVTRRFRAGSESIGGVAYGPRGAVMARETWSGDIWIADVKLE